MEPPKEPTNQSEVELEVIIHEPINVTSLTPPVPTESIASTQNPDATPPAKKRNPFRSLSVRQWFLVSELIFLSVAVMFVELCLVPALPEIMKQFYEDSDWVPWILSIYNIIGAVWTPISGSLADMFGPKWITIASLSVYMIGQVVCALSSSSIFVLIAGRALQGFGMAIFVLGLTIVRTSFPDELVTPLMGIISNDDGNTSVEDADADDEGPMTMRKRFFKMDVIGAFLLAAGVIMILMSFTLSDSWGWDDVGTLCLVIIGFCLLVVLVFWELWVPHPIIPVKSLLNRNQLVLIFVSVTSGLAQFALFQMLPYLYMEPSMAFKVEPSDMLQVGLYLLPFGVAMIAAMPGALGFGMTLGYPVANVVSSAVTVLGIGLMIEYHDTVAQTVILNTVAGVGLGMLTIAIINMITVISKSDEFGAISGANLCLKFVGGSLGPVLVTIFLNKHSYTIAYSVSVSDSSDGYETHYYTGYSEQSFKDAFIFLTAVTGAALIGSCSLSGMFKFLTAKGRKEIRDLAKMSAAGH
ncbi:bicyclomycin/multidrug efflux system [Pelomyxa schiedti]|nr:bicyclomycin/multidrug efflux system [Pelomyxa schiedti]